MKGRRTIFFLSVGYFPLFGLTRNEKTSVMTTPKRPGAHIWQICLADLPPTIEHRSRQYRYTNLGRSTPCQLSIDPMNTATPNLADLPPCRSANGSEW